MRAPKVLLGRRLYRMAELVSSLFGYAKDCVFFGRTSLRVLLSPHVVRIMSLSAADVGGLYPTSVPRTSGW